MTSRNEQYVVRPNVIINKRGLGFFSALTLLLIVLKIIGYNISWWWIIASFFGPIIVLGVIIIGMFLFMIGCFIVALLIDYYDSKQAKKRRIEKRKSLNRKD